MTLWKQIIVLATLCLAMRASRTYANYDSPESYLEYCNFTQDQTKYILEKSDEVRNKDHYIKWIWAISAHEMWSTFKDWETKFFAGRLAPAMKYKDFKTQVDWWTTAYNKYWRKNNTASDWINRSKYCVSDTHWGGEGCPNWLVNTKAITSLYKANNTITNNDTKPLKRVVADKVPVGTQKRCRKIFVAPAKGYVQVDRFQKFYNRLLWIEKNDVIFRCREIQKSPWK